MVCIRSISMFLLHQKLWITVKSDISPVTSIGEAEIYFVINPKRPDIKKALDSAMRRIKDDKPIDINTILAVFDKVFGV